MSEKKVTNLLLLIFIGIFLLFCDITQAAYSGIEILSQEYSISGNIDVYIENGDYPDGITFYDSYDETSVSPVSASITDPYINSLYTSSYADLFSIGTHVNGFDHHGEGSAFAHASAICTFILIESTPLELSFQVSQSNYSEGGGGLGITVVLTDITDDTELFYFHGFGESGWDSRWDPMDQVHVFDGISLEHEYSLTMTTSSSAAYDGDWHSYASATVTPEPATILLLGLGGLALRRRK